MPEYNLYSNLFKKKCCPPKPLKKNIYNPNLISKFPLNMRIAHQIVASVGTANQCYTVVDKQLNAYGKWAGCPGGSGPGYSSTMRYMPYENSSGLGPSIGGSICNCNYQDNKATNTTPITSPPVNTTPPVISGNTVVGYTLTTTEGTWTGNPSPTFMYQWLRNGVVIGGATIITYVTQVADVGQQITCRVTGTNILGSANAISNVITPILSPPQTITFTGTVNFEIIYVDSLNQVVVPNPVLNGFTIYRVTSTSAGASYVINSNLPSTSISFLVIGGGGTGGVEGGSRQGGGGGAGGFIESSGTTNTATTYLIYVGTGGAASNIGANGEDSLLQLTSGTLTAIGGGRGGNITNLNGSGGGSGGGGGFINSGNFGTGGAGTPGQGFSGAPGFAFVATYFCGGGGAGADGVLGGGVGLSSTITGQSIFYAGGGAGGFDRIGGIGGGGNSGTSGTDGLGGGGGSNASGGDGIVILRIPSFV